MIAKQLRTLLRGIPDNQEVAMATWESTGRHYYRFNLSSPMANIKEIGGKTIAVIGSYDCCAAAEIRAEQ